MYKRQAHKYYDNPEYHWTILVANDIIDYYDDWPMSTQRFEQFVKDKYTNPQAIHHYEISQTSGDTETTIDVGMNTNSEYFIATIQDVMNLSEEFRTNIPGKNEGNWILSFNQEKIIESIKNEKGDFGTHL